MASFWSAIFPERVVNMKKNYASLIISLIYDQNISKSAKFDIISIKMCQYCPILTDSGS